MSKLAFLPFIIFFVSTVLAWATAKHMEMAGEHRAHASSRPRGRPYSTRMPDLFHDR